MRNKTKDRMKHFCVFVQFLTRYMKQSDDFDMMLDEVSETAYMICMWIKNQPSYVADEQLINHITSLLKATLDINNDNFISREIDGNLRIEISGDGIPIPKL